MPRFLVLLCTSAAALMLFAAAAAAAPTTRFASPGGTTTPSQCTDVASPCSLPVALASAQAEDSLSLAGGSYDLAAVALPAVPLHWAATDPRVKPVLTSAAAAPTLRLTAAQSGTSLDHLEIDNTNRTGTVVQPALAVAPGVAATVRSAEVNGRTCVDAPDAGAVTIEDSKLLTSSAKGCLDLGPQSTVRRSTVGHSTGLLPQVPPPVLVTKGLVEDSDIEGGVLLNAPTATARRVRAVGPTAIAGEGLVVDSLARGFDGDGAAIAADASLGGTLRVVNSTAVSTAGPALVARESSSATSPVVPNDLVVSNSIARGKTTDIQAPASISCALDSFCEFGFIHIDHSAFATRDPLATARGGIVISEGIGNVAGDPRFVDQGKGDFHLGAGSPAIDAGVALDAALPFDLDGGPRLAGRAPDLGAFETQPPPEPVAEGDPPPTPITPTDPGPGGGGVEPPHGPAILTGLRVNPSRLRVGTRGQIAFALDGPARVTMTFERVLSGHRRNDRCLTGRKRRGPRCTILRSAGAPTAADGRAGTNIVRFSGRLARKALPPGSYRLTATPAGGQAHTARFRILARRAGRKR